MAKVRANGIDIAYEKAGKGHPLLLIAGVGYGGWFWHRIVPGLAARFEVITFDNRGAGESDKPEGPYTVPMLAEDTIGLIDALRIERTHILGHSLGGYVAQELAAANLDPVSKLILASTNHGGQNVIPIPQEALDILTDRSGDPESLVRRGINIACAPGFSDRQPGMLKELIAYRFTNPVPAAQYQAQVAAGAAMAFLSDDEVNARMTSLNLPVLVLFGACDRVVPPGNADLLAGKLPQAQVKLIPDTGHIFPLEEPDATVQAIQAFLTGEPGSPADGVPSTKDEFSR